MCLTENVMVLETVWYHDDQEFFSYCSTLTNRKYGMNKVAQDVFFENMICVCMHACVCVCVCMHVYIIRV